jgi:hypothetical protein
VAVGQTVRPLLADRPPGRRGLSARLGGVRGSIGCPGTNNGLSAPGCRTVHAPREPSAWAPRTVRGCRARVGPRPRDENEAGTPSLLQPDPGALSSSLSCSLSRKGTPLGISFGALPGPSEHIPRLSARFSTMSSRYFFRISHSLSLSDFE